MSTDQARVVGTLEFVEGNDHVEAGLIVRADTEFVILGAWLKGDGDYTIAMPPAVARQLIRLIEAALDVKTP
ncbi:MAG TPA: hypothetical protein VF960_07485 [Chloroflexota bacterium]